MLYDLIRALPVAILVCFLPGWFWTRLLDASADRAEQVAYSVALAITLVPTAALVLSRLLGTGVTLAVAVAAPLLVFLAGLLAYLWFGPAKGPDAPLAPLPAPPRTPALVALTAALALAVVAFFDLVSGVWSAILVVPLVLLAGYDSSTWGTRNSPHRPRPRPLRRRNRPVGRAGQSQGGDRQTPTRQPVHLCHRQLARLATACTARLANVFNKQTNQDPYSLQTSFNC